MCSNSFKSIKSQLMELEKLLAKYLQKLMYDIKAFEGKTVNSSFEFINCIQFCSENGCNAK